MMFNSLNEQKIQFAFEKCTAHTTIKANPNKYYDQTDLGAVTISEVT